MGIQRKIDEIRQKPEHIRVRYVWFAVSVCMFFLVMVWIFSIRDQMSGGFFKNNQSSGNGNALNILNNDLNAGASVENNHSNNEDTLKSN